MPLNVQLGQSQQQYSQGRVADLSGAEAAKQDQKLKAINEFAGAVASGATAFVKGATNRVNVQGMQDAIQGNKNEYIQDSKLLSGLYNQSYNQTQARTKVADFQNAIPSLYEQGLATGKTPEDVQRDILARGQQLDTEMDGLELDDAFRAELSEGVSASYRSMYKIASELQAGQAVSNAQAGLQTSIGATTATMQMSLEAGDAGGARSQLDSALRQIESSQWLKPAQKQEMKQQLFLQAAANATSPHAVQWLQEQAEQTDAVMVALRPRFKEAQYRAGEGAQAAYITAMGNFQTAPNPDTLAQVTQANEAAFSSGAINEVEYAQNSAALAKAQAPLMQKQAAFAMVTGGSQVRAAAVHSGMDPDNLIKDMTGAMVPDAATGAQNITNPVVIRDPDMYASVTKEVAKQLAPSISILANPEKLTDEQYAAAQAGLQAYSSIATPEHRAAVRQQLPADAQVMLQHMEDAKDFTPQGMQQAKQAIVDDKKVSSGGKNTKAWRESVGSAVSSMNTTKWFGSDSAWKVNAGNEKRLTSLINRTFDGLDTAAREMGGVGAAQVKARQHFGMAVLEQSGRDENVAYTSRGTDTTSLAKQLQLGENLPEFTGALLRQAKAKYPNAEFSGALEYQADGSLVMEMYDSETGLSIDNSMSAADIRTERDRFLKSKESAEAELFYKESAVKPFQVQGMPTAGNVYANDVRKDGYVVPGGMVANAFIATAKHEGYDDKPYRDAKGNITYSFGLSETGGHKFKPGATMQEQINEASHLFETKYMPQALGKLKSAGFNAVSEPLVMLASDLAWHGDSKSSAIYAAIKQGDAKAAVAALQQTPAWKAAAAGTDKSPESIERNKRRIAWINAAAKVGASVK
jgi:GH24 family phage-related lysozyme (muramidase)